MPDPQAQSLGPILDPLIAGFLCASVLRCLSRQTAKICLKHRAVSKKMSSSVNCQSRASIVVINTYENACNAENITAICPVHLQ